MTQSMTAFADSVLETPLGRARIELKSVNSRFLELTFKLSDELRSIEAPLRELLTTSITRGKVECKVHLQTSSPVSNTKLDEAQIKILLAWQSQVLALSNSNTAPNYLSVSDILRWPGVVSDATLELPEQDEALVATLIPFAQKVLADFKAARQREGARLAEMMRECLHTMQGLAQQVHTAMPKVLEAQQAKLSQRLLQGVGAALASHSSASNLVGKDELLERIRQEVTLYGIKIDISEELTRLQAHIDETRAMLDSAQPIGKRLDFMMQELNREANTLGSKSATKEVADVAMELKLLIEKMREQVQNIE